MNPRARRPSLLLLASILALGVAAPLGLGGLLRQAESDASRSSAVRTRVFLVRHADRNGKADELTAAGIERARSLAHVLEKSAIDVVFHSDRARTRETAKPVCEALGLVPIERPAGEVEALIAEIRRDHAGKTILIVGHSDTVPQFWKALGGPEFAIADSEFDDLCVVEFGEPNQPANFLRLQYGARSP